MEPIKRPINIPPMITYLVKAKRALVLEDLHGAVHVAGVGVHSVGVRLHPLHLGLDHVQRQRAGGGEESSGEGGGGLNLVQIPLGSASQIGKGCLGNVLGREHACSKEGFQTLNHGLCTREFSMFRGVSITATYLQQAVPRGFTLSITACAQAV